MPTLVVEDGTGLVNANSYIDVAYADSYFTNKGDLVWDTYTLADKETYVFNAATAVDAKWGSAYRGTMWTSDQAMLFPRTTFIDGNGRKVAAQTIPKELKDTQCEMAFTEGAGTDLFIDPDSGSSNVKQTSSGVGRGAVEESVTYFSPTTSSTYTVPLTLIRPILKATAFTGSAIRG